jgi:hypothetical protein
LTEHVLQLPAPLLDESLATVARVYDVLVELLGGA